MLQIGSSEVDKWQLFEQTQFGKTKAKKNVKLISFESIKVHGPIFENLVLSVI